MLKDTHNIPALVISRFCMVGISFHKANATERGLFAIQRAQIEKIIADGKMKGMRSVFALSTCNRTELYGFCHHEDELAELLISHTNGNGELFRRVGKSLRGHEAVRHLFEMAAGLQSQIVGDYEILGQLKTAIAVSRSLNSVGPIMDRILNFVFQASKQIKSQTHLSNGTVSVSYAAIEWMKKIEGIATKKIVLLGTGKLGKSVVKNIQFYFNNYAITLVNRTSSIAEQLADETGSRWAPIENLTNEISEADIVIACTNADYYTLAPNNIQTEKEQLFLDLSVPQNVDPAIQHLNNKKVVGIDEVSEIMNSTISKRKAEVPKADSIIEQNIAAFNEWLHMHRHTPLLQTVKQQLYEMGNHFPCEMAEPNENIPVALNQKVNKAIGILANNLRYKKEKGCQYISAYSEFLKT